MIEQIVGKTYSHVTNKGTQTNITFITDKICKGWGSEIADVTSQGRRVTIKWRNYNKSVVALDFSKDLKRYSGMSDIDGQVNGKILEPDFTKATNVSRKFETIPGIIPMQVQRKTLNSKAFFNARKNSKDVSPIYMVVSGYRIPENRVEDFLIWNNGLFKRYGIKVILVLDKPLIEMTNKYPFVTPIIYPVEQDIFSIGKTVNYGIRRVPSDNSIVVKTDIDIIFTDQLIHYLNSSVSPGNGTICLCHHIADPKVIPVKITQWGLLNVDPEGRGACFAMMKSDWSKLKGYDERIEGWGGDDNEMWMRAKRNLNLTTNKSFPLFHVNHPPRTTKDFFPYRSKENMAIANIGDWSNDTWGQAGIFNTRRTFVLAITTVNRLNYLRECIRTFTITKSNYVDWKLIIADDGSNDGTVQYINNLKIPNVEVIPIFNVKRGIHHQVNTIIQKLSKMKFDVCFKVDDDVIFAQSGWDTLYYGEIYRTGYDHLCLYQPEWKAGKPLRTYNGLVSMIDIENVQGAFYTITKNIIDNVGYMDTQNFGLTGLGHVDFTARCCRAGFNRIESPLDVNGSKDYIKLQKGNNYKSAIPMEWRHKENTSSVLKMKTQLILNESRVYIPYTETSLRVGDKK